MKYLKYRTVLLYGTVGTVPSNDDDENELLISTKGVSASPLVIACTQWWIDNAMQTLKENISARMSNLFMARGSHSRSSRLSVEQRSSSHVDPSAEVASGNHCFQGICLVGNGRSVLSNFAGPAIDRFATVVRFNEYQLTGYEKHVRCAIECSTTG